MATATRDRVADLVGTADARRLKRVAGALHRIAERYCTEDMPDAVLARVERREASLEAEARETAARHGLNVYLQGDPRGWPLYLWAQADLDAYNGRRASYPCRPDDGKLPIDSVYSSIGVGIAPR